MGTIVAIGGGELRLHSGGIDKEELFEGEIYF